MILMQSCQDVGKFYCCKYMRIVSDRLLIGSWRRLDRSLTKTDQDPERDSENFFFTLRLKILKGSYKNLEANMTGSLKNPVSNPDRILKFHGYTFLSGFMGFLTYSWLKRQW